MKKFAPVVLALALVAAACGDDAGSTTSTEAMDTSTTEAMTDTSEAMTTTTEAMTTSTEAMTTTTADPMAAMYAELEAYAGTYTGQWNNTTFGSDGSIEWSLSLDEESGAVVLGVDLGGFVFGASDPDPEEFSLPFADLIAGMGSATIDSATFGQLQVTVGEDGTIELRGDDVPGDRIASILITGTFTPDGGDLGYVVEFEDGGAPAEGTATFTKS